MLSAITNHTESNIALVAQQPSNLIACVAVINMIIAFAESWTSTYGTYPFLEGQKIIELLYSNPVELAKVLISHLYAGHWLTPPLTSSFSPCHHVGPAFSSTLLDILICHADILHHFAVNSMELTA